jgi:hypothetical protein
VQLASGAHVDVVSDESWQGARGPLVQADVYQGETYDANLSMPGWSRAGFATLDAWVNVTATVRRPLRPFWRPFLTEIYLCNVCLCQKY